jgi:hypothetical protein
MKFIAIIKPKKDGAIDINSFIYDGQGEVPPIIDPPEPDEPKDMPPDDKEAREILPPRPLARKKARPPLPPN